MGAPELELLITFAVLLIGAEAGSLLFRWLRLPRVVGMIAAGVLIGPHVNPWADVLSLNPDRIQDLSFLGGLFLMFSIGLSFNVKSFRRVGLSATLLSLVGSILSFLGGVAVALYFGYSREDAMFLALVLTPTSSIIAFRMARDQRLLASRGVDTTLGSVILDDITILVFATLVVGVNAHADADGAFTVVVGIALVLALAAIVVWAGLKALPRTLHLFERLGGENPTLLAISLAFLVAFCFTLLDLPPIFGAFWAGSILASSRFGDQIVTYTRPIIDLFGAVFFTAIGMLLDPRAFPVLGLIALALIVVGTATRLASGYLSLRILQTPALPAIACATLLIPKGEVNLVVAQYAGDPALVSELQMIATALVMATTLLAPLILAMIRAIARRNAPPKPAAT